MQQIPKRKKGMMKHGIMSKCMVCGDKFEFVSASFVSICNDCRKHHEDSHKEASKK